MFKGLYTLTEHQSENFLWSICYCVFPLPDSYADSYSDSYCNNMQKGSTGTNSNGYSDAKLLWKLLKKPPCWYQYWCQIGYSTHLQWNRNQNRFSANSSAHYYISHLNQNRNRNRSLVVETHHERYCFCVWLHLKFIPTAVCPQAARKREVSLYVWFEVPLCDMI